MKNTVIIYHKNCLDGSASAWSAWLKYREEAIYVPASDRENLPSEIIDIENKKEVELYILDFSYPKEVLLKLQSEFKKLTILDHHKTAKEAIMSIRDYVYSEDKSAAYLSWEYFHPNEEVPLIVKYISEGDMWRYSLPDYSLVLSYINSSNGKNIFDSLSEKRKFIDDHFDQVLVIGKILEENFKEKVNQNLENKYKINFAGYEVWAVNGSKEYRSHVGNELAELSGTFGVYFYIHQNILRVSLRSVPDFDVSVIATKLGGGGHKNSSGIDVDFDGQSLFNFSNSNQ
ncbi:MAG: hypothetical protein QG614_527 [Patescibacteria group bacterium]|nr:hypothetical protein [Patescibacteria group bacterium]